LLNRVSSEAGSVAGARDDPAMEPKALARWRESYLKGGLFTGGSSAV